MCTQPTLIWDLFAVHCQHDGGLAQHLLLASRMSSNTGTKYVPILIADQTTFESQKPTALISGNALLSTSPPFLWLDVLLLFLLST